MEYTYCGWCFTGLPDMGGSDGLCCHCAGEYHHALAAQAAAEAAAAQEEEEKKDEEETK